MSSSPRALCRVAAIDGRATLLTVEGDAVVCVSVRLRDAADRVSTASVRAVIREARLRCGVEPSIAWVEARVDEEGVWRGVATFRPASWRPAGSPRDGRVVRR